MPSRAEQGARQRTESRARLATDRPTGRQRGRLASNESARDAKRAHEQSHRSAGGSSSSEEASNSLASCKLQAVTSRQRSTASCPVLPPSGALPLAQPQSLLAWLPWQINSLSNWLAHYSSCDSAAQRPIVAWTLLAQSLVPPPPTFSIPFCRSSFVTIDSFRRPENSLNLELEQWNRRSSTPVANHNYSGPIGPSGTLGRSGGPSPSCSPVSVYDCCLIDSVK